MTRSGARQFIAGLFRRYLANTRGNITMLTGLASIPVIAAAGMAIDYARISRVHDQIQMVADGATLASASARYINGNTTQKSAARIQIATNFLKKGLADVTDTEFVGNPQVTLNGASVSVKVTARVKGSLINVLDVGKQSALLGMGGGGDQEGHYSGRSYTMVVKSKARWTAGVNYICLLALNPTVDQSLMVKGTADITAKSCSIQVNSSSSSGLYQNGAATITAASICVHGGNYYGSSFSPMPFINCDVFNDPLATKFASDYAATYTNGSPTMRYSSNAQMSFPAGPSTIYPGVYKGGIKVGQNVALTLSPGTYFIKDGAFEVHPGGSVTGTGVTIVLMGNSGAYLDVQGGADLNVKAPATGPFAGLAIAQHPLTIPTVAKGNSIIGGGSVNMTGIIYFPKQTLLVTGAGDISIAAPLFSIVADIINIQGNGQLNIGQSSDFDAAGLPALPSTGEGKSVVSLN